MKAISERKEREKAEREQRIIGAAKMLAEKDGWASVTLHGLAELERHGRIRAAFRKERVTHIIDVLARKS
ncbi:hypothetical protein [Rhizobium leguminosarum]|uniref:hypothetical protein n=1 Tax=Rhizobium leguminosarum TaxID=384 RepID=UPI001FDF568D|nr:hypothetical protein [Rhizobium leguminosarum]